MTFKAPYCLALLQALTTCAVFFLQIVSSEKNGLSSVHARAFISPGVLWAVPLALNLQALRFLNPETLVMFRALTILGVSAGDFVILKRIFKRHEVMALLVIITGSFLYVSGDLHFDAEGYAWGVAYSISLVTCMLVLKVAFNSNKDVNNSAKTLYLNFFGSFIFALFVLIFEQGIIRNAIKSMDYATSTLVVASCVLGVLMGYLSSATRDELSPTTFDVVTTVAKFSTLAISWLLFRTKYSFWSILGITITLLGGVLYSPYILTKDNTLTKLVTNPGTWIGWTVCVIITIICLFGNFRKNFFL